MIRYENLPAIDSGIRRHFNCMSYALGVYNDWLVPRTWCREKVDLVEVSKELCEEYKLIRVEHPDEVPKQFYVIAFRYEPKNDFHFLLRKGGQWLGKAGSYQRIGRFKKSKVFADNWTYRYSSDILFFVHQEDFIEMNMKH